jgi:phage protein D
VRVDRLDAGDLVDREVDRHPAVAHADDAARGERHRRARSQEQRALVQLAARAIPHRPP